MKVTIVMPLGEVRGGAERALVNLLRGSSGMAVEWHVVFLQGGPLVGEVRQVGAEAVHFGAGRLRHVHRMTETTFRIARYLRRVRSDHVVGWMSKAHLYGSPAGSLARVDTSWYQHGLPSRRSWLELVASRLPAQRILVCSNAAARAQRSLPPRRPIRVVNPGIDLDASVAVGARSPREVRQGLGLPVEGPIIGTVSRLQRSKGIHFLVEAIPRIAHSFPDVRCLIVGGAHDLEPEYLGFLRDRIRDLRLDDRVALVGYQSNPLEWMRAMDVVVQAGDNEAFGLSLLEAMALGKPVIAGDAGGSPEIIASGENGFLVPYGDVTQLVEVAAKCLSDPAGMKSLGRAAETRVQEFSAERYANRFLEALGSA